MIHDRLYHALRLLGTPFRYSCNGQEILPDQQPVLFVSNHCGPIGPVACVLSLPRRVYPWIVVDMLDPKRIVPYLYQDFITNSLHLQGPFGWFLAKAIAKIALPLLQGLGCIAVDRYDVRFFGAFHRSLELLEAGKSLLIFPEDPLLPINPETGMRPFMSGFLWLCVLYERKTGKRLPVIPTAVIPSKRRIILEEPMFLPTLQSPKEDMRKLAQEIEIKVSRLLKRADLSL